MQIAFEVILVTGIFGGFLGEHTSALPVADQHVIAKDLDETIDNMFISISNDQADNTNEVEVISRVQEVFMKPIHNGQQKTQTAYVIITTTRRRNKRHISYLTLCHFKICNMGRKRTQRYMPVIRKQEDNET